MVELHRSIKNKLFAGVCGGLAESINVTPILMRFLFLLSIFWGGSGILVYIILWAILPLRDYEITFDSKLVRPYRNKMIGGVCAGLAAYFKMDVSILRLVFIIATLYIGYGILAYVILWLIIPREVIEV